MNACPSGRSESPVRIWSRCVSSYRLLGRRRICHCFEPDAYDGGDALVEVLHVGTHARSKWSAEDAVAATERGERYLQRLEVVGTIVTSIVPDPIVTFRGLALPLRVTLAWPFSSRASRCRSR